MIDHASTLNHRTASPAFVGRWREFDLIFGQISAAQRGNVALFGPLGIGKTSLLKQVANPELAAAYGLGSHDYRFVYVDLQSVTPFSGTRFWHRVAHLLRRQGPGATAVEPALDALLARDPLDIIDIEEFLDALADAGQVLVLLLDELEWALQAHSPESAAESRNFLAQTASLARRSPRVLSLIVATVPPLHEATRVLEGWRGSPFATVFTSLRIAPLDGADALDLLQRSLDGGDPGMSEADRDMLLRLASGQPAALQAAAFSLRSAAIRARPAHEAVIEAMKAVRDVLESFHSQAAPMEPPPPSLPALPPESAPAPGATIPASGLWLDPITAEVLLNGRRVDNITALEYSLLSLLYSRPGRLCTKEDIILHVWGKEAMNDHGPADIDESRVEKLISRLRRKVEPMPGRPQLLRTVRGRGYRYVPGRMGQVG